MQGKTSKWESELWSCLNTGDGIKCPVYESCTIGKKGKFCLGSDREICDKAYEFTANDLLKNKLDPDISKMPNCLTTSKIFRLVRRLAYQHLQNLDPVRLPIPYDLIKKDYNNLPIEVHLIPLKAIRGAVWRLQGSWLIYINSEDSSARRRFTLYHEIFHILAHNKSNPVFKKYKQHGEGAFNEMLADHFSGAILAPHELILKKWLEVKSISKMAEIFEVPEPVIYSSMQVMRLI